MDKGKIVAVITGAISILIASAYLVLVQLIDFRGEMIPAPINQLPVINYQTLISKDADATYLASFSTADLSEIRIYTLNKLKT